MSLSTLFLVVFLLLFAGLLAGCESALTSLSRLLIEELVEAYPKYKKRFDRFVENPARYLNVLLLVRKSCELTATALVATSFVENTSNNTSKCYDVESYDYGYAIAKDQQGLIADCNYLYEIATTQKNISSKSCFCQGVSDFRSGK